MNHSVSSWIQRRYFQGPSTTCSCIVVDCRANGPRRSLTPQEFFLGVDPRTVFSPFLVSFASAFFLLEDRVSHGLLEMEMEPRLKLQSVQNTTPKEIHRENLTLEGISVEVGVSSSVNAAHVSEICLLQMLPGTSSTRRKLVLPRPIVHGSTTAFSAYSGRYRRLPAMDATPCGIYLSFNVLAACSRENRYA